MNIVTSGSAYLDIDAYGGIAAYAELLNVQGNEAVAATSTQPNESVTRTILGWGEVITPGYQSGPEDTFTLIDVSNPDYFDPMVDIDQVTGVIDHHPGLEDFWQQRLGSQARIEAVGAACTQVYEEWKKADTLDQMSQLSARLLITGVLDNTLNFGAAITTDRDHEAYHAMLPLAGLPEDWPAQYFGECQTAIQDDIEKAINNDKKAGMINLPKAVGQLVIWDSSKILAEHLQEVEAVMAKDGDGWFMNLVSIKDGKSTFLAENPDVKKQLEDLLHITFNGNIATAERMWLRKEIQKVAL